MRVAALTISGVGAIFRGIAYIDAPNTRLTTFVDSLVPLHVWALVWIAAGVFIFVGIWHRIIARWALSLTASLWAVWSISYMLSWIIGDQSRGWVTGTAMAVVAGLTWIIAALADGIGPPPGPVIPDEQEAV